MANDVTIDPRYSKYDNSEIERILDSVAEFDDKPTEGSAKPAKSGGVATAISEAVANRPTTEDLTETLGGYYTKEQADELLAQKQDSVTLASEQDVIDIVENYGKDPEPEPEPDPEPEPELE